MKQLSVILAILLLLTSLASCMKEEPPKITVEGQLNDTVSSSVLEQGKEYFSQIGMVTGMSEPAFRTWLRNFKYDGKVLITAEVPSYFNYEDSSGMRANHRDFNYSCVTAASEQVGKQSYTYTLVSRVELEGLTYPWGITREDTLHQVFEKIGLGIDPIADFKADENMLTDMTLLTSDDAVLVFTDLTRVGEEMTYLYPYSLTLLFYEDYKKMNGDDIEALTRFIFSFDEEFRITETGLLVQEMSAL